MFIAEEEEEQQHQQQQQQQQQRTSFSNGRVENIVARKLRNHGSIPDTVRNLSLLASIQTGWGAHPASFSMGTMDSAGGKAAGR